MYAPLCVVCARPVDLTESKTDENGQAIHENCYIWTVELKKPGPLTRPARTEAYATAGA
jgi:hypothetical protein